MKPIKNKTYLICIRTERGNVLAVGINGDTPARPFSIGGGLWSYNTPGHAARQLETLAQCWEGNGIPVRRVYGRVCDMQQRGNDYNAAQTVADWRS